MQSHFRAGLLSCVVAVAALVGCASAPPEAPWPEQQVDISQMQTSSPWQVKIPLPAPDLVRDRSRSSTVVLEVFVDADGQVLRSRVAKSSGNALLDAAALQALRELRFAPYRGVAGAQAVTVVASMSFPFYDRPR